MLTLRQKQILDFIIGYSKKRGISPSLEEIKKHFRLNSVSNIHQHLEALKTKGYLRREKNQQRGTEIEKLERLVKIPLLGTIAAGQPITLFDVPKETIAVPKSKVFSLSEIYALRVIGNSMIDENINDGDIILVKHQETAENGQKVVALIDNQEATLKKFYKEKGHIRLQPANKNMEPLIFRNGRDVSIQGIVLDVIREEGVTEIRLPEYKDKEEYRKLPINKIICGDAVEYLKKIPSKSVDLVVADPPYNLSTGNHINFNNQGLKGFGGEWNKVMEDWDHLPFQDYLKFSFAWLSQIKRVLKPTGSVWVFGTYHNIGMINLAFQALGIEIINEVVWYKRNAFPNLAGRRLTASHETLLWGHVGEKKREYYFDYKKSKEYYDPSDLMKTKDKQMRTVWDVPNNKEARELQHGKHPTQKPLSICKRIISISSKPDDLVLVPFAGAGSECLAAKELDRNFLGFELDRKYIDIAKMRIDAAQRLNPLFS